MLARFSILLPLVVLPLVGAASSVEMPEWNEATEATGYSLGGGLWPGGLLPGEDSESGEEGEVAEAGSAEKIEENPVANREDLEFFGPAEGTEPLPTEVAAASPVPGVGLREQAGSDLPGSGEAVAEEAEPLPPIEGELQDLYFEHSPVEFLVDPQRLLTEQKSNDIKRFLEFHSDESPYHIYVFVVGESQKIPDEVDLQQLHREWFSDNPTVMMVYYREAPDMTEFVYNDSVTSSLPGSVFERIRQNCLREGAATDLAPDQVEKMAIELSIQLYWLSRLREAETSGTQEITADTPVHELPASEDAPELLREYAPGIFLEESGRKVVSIILTALLIVGAVVAFAAAGWVVLWWRGRDRVSGGPLIFPSFHVVPRLGGEYSGGGFVGMSFEVNDSV